LNKKKKGKEKTTGRIPKERKGRGGAESVTKGTKRFLHEPITTPLSWKEPEGQREKRGGGSTERAGEGISRTRHMGGIDLQAKKPGQTIKIAHYLTVIRKKYRLRQRRKGSAPAEGKYLAEGKQQQRRRGVKKKKKKGNVGNLGVA